MVSTLIGITQSDGTAFFASGLGIALKYDLIFLPSLCLHRGECDGGSARIGRSDTIQALDQRSTEDLHYSGPMAITESAARRLRALLLDTIEKMETIISEPGQEDGFCVAMDFFRL